MKPNNFWGDRTNALASTWYLLVVIYKGGVFVFKIVFNISSDNLIQRILIDMITITNDPGEIADVSAETKILVKGVR